MKPILALSLFAAMAGFSFGASIVQTQSYSFVPDNSTAFTFNKFNPALGTLTSITITTNLTKSDGSLFVDNDAGTPASGNVSQTVRIDLSSVDVNLLDSGFSAIGTNITAVSFYTVNLSADDGDGVGYQAGGTDSDGTTFSDISTSQTRGVNSGFFSQYTGTDTYDITLDGIQSINTSAISGAAGTFTNASASGDVTITYNYIEAVPEPTTALLGGLGLVALIRRRR